VLVGPLRSASNARRSLPAALAAFLAGACSTTGDQIAWDGASGDETGSETGDGDGEQDGGAEDPGAALAPACDAEAPSVLGLDPGDPGTAVFPPLARRAILAGDGSLAAVNVVPAELFNYYDIEPPATAWSELGLSVHLDQPDLDPAGEWTLQVAVAPPPLDEVARPPVRLTFLVDASAGTEGDLFARISAAVAELAEHLRAKDLVSVVRLGEGPTVALELYEIEEASDPVLLDAIAGLVPAGEAALGPALDQAYELAVAAFDEQSLNRVVYLGADLGGPADVPAGLLEQHSEAPGQPGISVVAVGVGEPGDYDPALVAKLAAAGRGVALFLGDAADAERLLDRAFLSTMATTAPDLRLDVELPPGFRRTGRVEAPGAPPDAPPVPRDARANRAAVAHELVETCAPELLEGGSELRVSATWTDDQTGEPRAIESTTTFADAMAPASALHKGRALHAYADALAAWQAAASSEERRAVVLAGLAGIEPALALAPEDEDLVELVELLTKLHDDS
jgi:Ca-activated chloride channel family protein